MKVKEVILKLGEFNQELELKVTDGFSCKFYKGPYQFKEFTGDDGVIFLDMGVMPDMTFE